MKTQEIELNNGVYIPKIGFGTWQIVLNGKAETAVKRALDSGYRLIDTARIYGNEKGVGKAINGSTIPRDEIFVTTKLWNSSQGYESALKAFDDSLKRLNLDYIDLYLLHWPVTGKRLESWRALEEIYGLGKAKSIGVSNFTLKHLEELLKNSNVTPVVNQIEFHPFLYEEQKDLLRHCAEHGIVVEAYSPLAHGGSVMQDELLQKIGEKHGKTSAQVVLRWCVQHGTIPIPKSTSEDHIHENIHIFDFELDNKDMIAIDGLSRGLRTCWDPNKML